MININEVIKQAKLNQRDADVAVRYFDGEHDILKNRIVYVSDEGITKEDKYSSNIRIPHPFSRSWCNNRQTSSFPNPYVLNRKVDC